MRFSIKCFCIYVTFHFNLHTSFPLCLLICVPTICLSLCTTSISCITVCVCVCVCVCELNLTLFLRLLPRWWAPHSEESNSWASPTNSAWSVRRVSHSHRLVHTYNVQCTLQPLCYWTIIDLKRMILQAKATPLPLSNADYCNNIHPSPEYTNIQCVQFAIVDWPWFAQQETHCRICIAG